MLKMFKKNNSYKVQSQEEMANKNTGRRASENPSRINFNNESFNKLKEHLKRRSIADFNSVQCRFYTDLDTEIENYYIKSKETGSMEDLSASPEERQNKIKAKLRKFFNRRPTVDSLKKKGIYKDEPVFGCSLEQTTKNRKPRVPLFVQECVKYIESKEENMKTDGLYRASGNLSQVQKIRLEVDQNNLSIMKDEEDVHVLTGSLKLFFRELKEPLIPFKQLETALRATDKPSRKDRIKDFQKLVKSLPEPNYDTLKFLLQHLLKVIEYQEFNRMNSSNLAIVFGPTLMWPEQESANMALELMQQNVVIECLLKEFHEIFIH